MAAELLPSWNPGGARRAIEDFVTAVIKAGSPTYVAPEARIAVFDNDGTLWCEKPIPVQLAFIITRLSAMAEADPSLRTRQPWKAAHEKDHAWLGGVVTKHYQGDEKDVRVLLGGILKAFAGMTVGDYETSCCGFLDDARHPTLNRRFRDCAYQPMVELLRFLEANGFTIYIASGGDRDFMRSVTQGIYGIPPERVIGSSHALKYEENDDGGAVVYEAAPDVFDDGPVKPVRIWSRIGRRPIMAVGNSNGDIQMLQFAGGVAQPTLRMLVVHDDAAREFDYEAGAERVLALARTQAWTTISLRNDWNTVFAN